MVINKDMQFFKENFENEILEKDEHFTCFQSSRQFLPTDGKQSKSNIPSISIDIFALKVLFLQNIQWGSKNMPNHYLKLEFLKLHFVCFCFAADTQANPTDISSKKAGKFKQRV